MLRRRDKRGRVDLVRLSLFTSSVGVRQLQSFSPRFFLMKFSLPKGPLQPVPFSYELPSIITGGVRFNSYPERVAYCCFPFPAPSFSSFIWLVLSPSLRPPLTLLRLRIFTPPLHFPTHSATLRFCIDPFTERRCRGEHDSCF